MAAKRSTMVTTGRNTPPTPSPASSAGSPAACRAATAAGETWSSFWNDETAWGNLRGKCPCHVHSEELHPQHAYVLSSVVILPHLFRWLTADPPPGGTGRKDLLNIADYERAMLALPKGEFDYFSGGANDMLTLRENR